MIDFAALAARLLQQSRSLLPMWFPAGRLRGSEFCVGDLAGAEGESLKINVDSGKWADFSAGQQGGDLISLYAAMHGMGQAEAVKALEGDGTIATRVAPAPPKEDKRADWTPLPAPADAPKPTDEFYVKVQGEWTRRMVTARWAYTDAVGALLGYACRFEWHDGDELKKDVVPQVWSKHVDGRTQWRWRAFAVPRPLYNLRELHERPDAPVMVVEGEKKVEAIRTLAPQYVGIAWQGGAKAWKKSDWKPIHGRKVLLWPDADEPGNVAMWEIGHHVQEKCIEVKIILPEGVPDGWDCADALAEGWDWQRLKAWALPKIEVITGATNGQRKANAGVSEAQGRAADVGASPRGLAASPDAVAHDGGAGADGDDRDSSAAQADRGTQGGPRSDAEGDRGPEQPSVHGDRGREGRDAADRALPRTDAGSNVGASLRTQADPAPATAQRPTSVIGQWLAWGLDFNSRGTPEMNIYNVSRVLANSDFLRGVVWYDEFLDQIYTGSGSKHREWTQHDNILLQRYLQSPAVGLKRIGMENVINGVIAASRENTRNCVRDWVESVEYDGIERMTMFFIDVFGCDDNEYTRACGRNFWISMAARIYDPGCQVDNMIVLEGGQGLGKSQALRVIGGDWYASQHESATNAKAFAEILQGQLMIEIPEMDSFNKAEVNTIKKVVSCQSDRYRGAYERKAENHKRRCVLVGTTNRDDWNRDETGARRFWPIKCADVPVRLDILRDNRALLFAEAAAAFKAGATWWEMPEQRTLAEQRDRRSTDPWTEAIAGYIYALSEVTVQDLLIGCLKFELSKVGKFDQMRVASCLVDLQWMKGGNVRRNGEQVKIWIRKNERSDVGAKSGGESVR